MTREYQRVRTALAFSGARESQYTPPTPRVAYEYVIVSESTKPWMQQDGHDTFRNPRSCEHLCPKYTVSIFFNVARFQALKNFEGGWFLSLTFRDDHNCFFDFDSLNPWYSSNTFFHAIKSTSLSFDNSSVDSTETVNLSLTDNWDLLPANSPTENSSVNTGVAQLGGTMCLDFLLIFLFLFLIIVILARRNPPAVAR